MFRSFVLPGVLIVSLFLSGCASQPRYMTRSGGEVLYGKVVAMHPIMLEGGRSGVGGFVGGAGGMIGGAQIGGGAAAHAAGALGGMIAGAVIGSAVEKALSRRPGWELTIRTSNGREFILPVEQRNPFYEGGEVKLVVSGFGEPLSIVPAN